MSAESGSLSVSELADLAEGLRQEGKYSDARKTVERCLKQSPGHPRALLLLGRLQYQEGKLLEALQTLRGLESVLGRQESLAVIADGLEQLRQMRNLPPAPEFATQTMAELLVQQGYLLEAIDIYRQLFVSCGGERRVWEKILSLREQLRQQGSRDAGSEKVARQLAGLDGWIEARQGED